MQFTFQGTDWKPRVHANARGEPTLATRKWRSLDPQVAHKACRESRIGELIASLHHVSLVHVLVTAKGLLGFCSISLAGRSMYIHFCCPFRQPTMTTLQGPPCSQQEVKQ